MIITSLLDNDIYKFTMMQAVFYNFPDAQVEYEFRCRNKGVNISPHANEIEREIHSLCNLRFSKEELNYLKSLRYMKPDFINFLKRFYLEPEAVEVVGGNEGLQIKIKGSWLDTILFEVPILAIVNEVYFKHHMPENSQEADALVVTAKERLEHKINLVREYNLSTNVPFLFSEFGTRRRWAFLWQQYVLERIKESIPGNLAGTSNVFFAMRLGLLPIGTMGHEWLQAMQAIVRVIDSQKHALQIWADEYRGDLGIALSDVVGMDAFLRDFDLYFCKLFDGARHDSGEAYEWTHKLIAHYKKHHIDPLTKRAIYSDGLDMNKAIALHKTFKNQIGIGFGIGTNLTNDTGLEPLNIVIKMTRCNGAPVAKISDNAGKTICKDEAYLAYLKSVFHIGK